MALTAPRSTTGTAAPCAACEKARAITTRLGPVAGFALAALGAVTAMRGRPVLGIAEAALGIQLLTSTG